MSSHARTRPATALLIAFMFTELSPHALSDQAAITIDGIFEDWADVPLAIFDGTGSGSGIDLRRLWLADDEHYLFLRLEVLDPLNLSENNNLRIYLDTDNDPSTGLPVDGIGAELNWRPGDRQGTFYAAGGSAIVTHSDLAFRAAPTFGSNMFEMAIRRDVEPDGSNPLFTGDTIRVFIRAGTSGDQMPNAPGGISYSFDVGSVPGATPTPFSRPAATDLRIVTHNVLFDNLFDAQLAPRFQRLYESVDPDILHLQEIYSHSATQTRNQIASWLGGTWYAAAANDCKTVSRYPILDSWTINGNLAVLIDTSSVLGTPMLCINAHLPCCDNETGRQGEADAIAAFIRDAYQPGGVLTLAADVPVVIAGDLNLVGASQPLTTLLTGDIQDSASHGPDFAPDPDGTGLASITSRHTDTRFSYTWRSDTSTYWPGQLDFLIHSDSSLERLHDFIIYTPDMSPASLAAAGLFGLDSLHASDHLVFSADFARPCPADLDQSGSVDLADLLQVIANWDTDGSTGGDANRDGAVDLADLLTIISGWGTDC